MYARLTLHTHSLQDSSNSKKSNDYMPIISIFKSFAMAELTATLSGISNVSDLRIKFNQYILQ